MGPIGPHLARRRSCPAPAVRLRPSSHWVCCSAHLGGVCEPKGADMESMRRTRSVHICTGQVPPGPREPLAPAADRLRPDRPPAARGAINKMTKRFLTALAAACIGCAGLAACGKAATPAAAPARTTSPTSSAAPATTPTTLPAPRSPSVASIESAICAIAVPHVGGGDHCAVSYLKISTVDPNWVHATIGLYNPQDRPESDESSVIFNLSTHELIGPADDGFCAEGTGTPIPGYSSVPANVLASFELTSCSSPATTISPTASTTTRAAIPVTLASLAGTWGAHEERLVIDATGTGHLSYADLTLCPNCSFATAPQSTSSSC
jgi:hypothetical protein